MLSTYCTLFVQDLKKSFEILWWVAVSTLCFRFYPLLVAVHRLKGEYRLVCVILGKELSQYEHYLHNRERMKGNISQKIIEKMFIGWQKSLSLMITDIDNARLYLLTSRWCSDSPVGGAGGGGSPGGGVPYDQGLPVPDGFPDRHSCSPRTRSGAQGPWVPALPRVYQGMCVWEVLCQELQKPIRKGEKLTAIRVVNLMVKIWIMW